MRVIGGEFKGFVFPRHSLNQTRPTTDRAKESLFNILNNRIDISECRVLDLYAGTGNISFECMSRGAEDVTCIESNFKAVSYIRATAEKLDVKPHIIKAKVLPQLGRLEGSFDLIFADPPYASPEYSKLVQEVFDKQLLNPGGWLILEHASQMQVDHRHLEERRTYGQSTFSFFTFESYEGKESDVSRDL